MYFLHSLALLSLVTSTVNAANVAPCKPSLKAPRPAGCGKQGALASPASLQLLAVNSTNECINNCVYNAHCQTMSYYTDLYHTSFCELLYKKTSAMGYTLANNNHYYYDRSCFDCIPKDPSSLSAIDGVYIQAGNYDSSGDPPHGKPKLFYGNCNVGEDGLVRFVNTTSSQNDTTSFFDTTFVDPPEVSYRSYLGNGYVATFDRAAAASGTTPIVFQDPDTAQFPPARWMDSDPGKGEILVYASQSNRVVLQAELPGGPLLVGKKLVHKRVYLYSYHFADGCGPFGEECNS